jgi:hypothetical protein
VVFDILRFRKYGLYAFLRSALFKEQRSTGEGEGFHNTFERKEGKLKQAGS